MATVSERLFQLRHRRQQRDRWRTFSRHTGDDTESGLTPARALLDYRQARSTQRLHARPKGGEGPGILDREGAALTPRLRAAASPAPGAAVELQEWVGDESSRARLWWITVRRPWMRQEYGADEIRCGPTGHGSRAAG